MKENIFVAIALLMALTFAGCMANQHRKNTRPVASDPSDCSGKILIRSCDRRDKI